MIIHGMSVITSEFVGRLVVPEHPDPKRLKKFRQRRLKRWRLAHPPYYEPTGQAYISGNTIVMHPVDFILLRNSMIKAGLLDAAPSPSLL